ncbi:MAG: transcription antitermination factor NusB [Candidatus Marinimicrobia bacterium]|nr:transcription antitermination factor NusB [Candidatus Neomarinimicrobiota bacterium]MDP6593585.1 transcription antitermination factor NusB [Candidatus Neomarinimicrobiota bacterium]MDP6836264.1 transcription antitermination factor NusB [Candidatus Neomarinimicrobiota bacterium]MDP6966752.1 transcription antitermination factor NusB [Candidatus Neomarinimicrobiota bacterium]
MKNRRMARELVLQGIYAFEMTGDPYEKILADLKRNREINADVEEFMQRLFSSTVEHADWSKQEIISRLENWDYERVALIDRLILQMMICEMVFLEDVPPKVSITEGVEISKKYSTEESGAFINGILDSIYHSLNELSEPV